MDKGIEIAFLQSKEQRDGAEEFRSGIFERAIGLQEKRVEIGQFLHLNIIRILRLNGIIILDRLAELKKLLEIGGGAAFGVFFTKTGIAALTGETGNFIFIFGVLGEVEEGLCICIQALYGFIGDTMVFYGYETYVFICVAESGDKIGFLLSVTGKLGEIDDGNCHKTWF